MSFAIFGLGNRQYEHFCAVGKRMQRALQALGGTLVGPRGEGDDDEDIEADFDKWRTQLFEALDGCPLLLTKTQVGGAPPCMLSQGRLVH